MEMHEQHPADFLVEAIPASSLPSLLPLGALPRDNTTETGSKSVTRRHYARIRLVATGVRPPLTAQYTQLTVPFALILEPLHFGILPSSILPVLSFLVPVVLAAWVVVAPRVYRYLSSVAQDIRVESVAPRKSQ
jgi:hypothetical protein